MMRITVASIGSRGDVQPFVALAQGLARAGHSVRVATCEPFRAMVNEVGLEFARIGGDIKAIVGDEGRAELLAAQGDLLRTFRAIQRTLRPMLEEGLDRMPEALAGSDVVIAHMLALGAFDYAERHGIPFFDASYLPLFPTRALAHPGAPVKTPPGIPSWISYIVAEQMMWQAFRGTVNVWRRDVLGLPAAPWLGPHTLRMRRRAPMLMGVSRAVLPPVRDWPPQAAATGFWFLDPPDGWTPPPRLVGFLDAGEPPIHIGFGSMTIEEPERTTRQVIEAVRKTRQRAILSAGWGALARQDDSDDILFQDEAPHSWLFPRVAAVVHHGGAGTTAAAMRAGVPQFITPFLADQPFWGHQVERLGVGPRAVPFPALDAENLRRALEAMKDPVMRRRARELGRVIDAERGVEEAVVFLEHRVRHGAPR